jgi:hypothetical protein
MGILRCNGGAQEFGVNKASDVMDSVGTEPTFDKLFVRGLQDPGSVEQECEVVIEKVRSRVPSSGAGKHNDCNQDRERSLPHALAVHKSAFCCNDYPVLTRKALCTILCTTVAANCREGPLGQFAGKSKAR